MTFTATHLVVLAVAILSAVTFGVWHKDLDAAVLIGTITTFVAWLVPTPKNLTAQP